MNILLVLNLPESERNKYLNRLKQEPGVTVNLVNHHTLVDPHIADTDVLITFGPHMADHVFEKAKRLRWVQALGTGVDGIADRKSLSPEVVVTSMHGVHADAVPEAALMAMLALARDLPRNTRAQAKHAWERWPAKLLAEKTAGVLGIGAIAEGLGPRLKAMRMKTVGITSSKRTVPGFDEMRPRDPLEAAVRDLDYLVVLTPLTPQTRGIVNAKVFAAMKPGSFFVNLARGGVVDEPALLEALKNGPIRSAALDVFATEPLPPEHPFWDMTNVIITPHHGGFHDEYADKALPTILHNLEKFRAGNTGAMLNVVKR